jgi:nitroreductase
MGYDASMVHDLIRTRRAIRRFKPDPIPPDVLDRILEAGIWAPSAMNRQPWKYFVLSEEMRDRLANLHQGLIEQMEDRIRAKYGEEGVEIRRNLYKNFADAPIAIVCFAEVAEGTPKANVISVALGCQNIVLSAWSEGVGSLIMTSSLAMIDEITFLCGVDQKKFELVAVILLGYPNETPEPPERRKKRVIYASAPSDIRGI